MPRDIYYIVYHHKTLKIAHTFKWFGANVMEILRNDKALMLINVTHPKNKIVFKTK